MVLELGIGARGQKLDWWGYRADKEVKFDDFFSCLDTIHRQESDAQTDGHRTTAKTALTQCVAR